MSANVESYIGRQAAWHALGKVKGRHFTWHEALAEGGLDFMVFKSQLRDGLLRPIPAWGTFRLDRDEAARGNREAAIFLGTVGESYRVINHSKGFELVDALVGEQVAGGAHYETAGVLGVGQVVWGLADLGLTTRVGDDEHKNYLLFSTGHDGSYSYQFRGVNERVVCNNTLDIALREKTKAVFRVRHTAKADQRITQAHEALGNLTADIRSTEQKLQWLAGRKVTREALGIILDRLFPQSEKDVAGQEQPVLFSSRQRDEKLAEVLTLFESNDGNAFPEQRGSAYNLLNAVTNFTDHNRGGATKRAESALFGSGRDLKTLAFDTILEASRTMPDLVRVDFSKTGHGRRASVV